MTLFWHQLWPAIWVIVLLRDRDVHPAEVRGPVRVAADDRRGHGAGRPGRPRPRGLPLGRPVARVLWRGRGRARRRRRLRPHPRTSSDTAPTSSGSIRSACVGPGTCQVPRAPCASLTPAPDRRALLREGAEAFAHVVGGEARARAARSAPGAVRASSSPSAASSSPITRLIPRTLSGALAASCGGPVERCGVDRLGFDDVVDEPPAPRRVRLDVAPEQEQLARPRRADRVDEAPHAGVRVDEPELGRRHAER